MHASPATTKNLLITGPPGIGKTTVIMRLAERLKDRSLAGFYTEEIRGDKGRLGFQVATFCGQSTRLAHVKFKTGPRVGRYRVDLAAFEKLALPELSRSADLFLIDEIGKMECFSTSFIEAVSKCLDAPTPLIATVAIKGAGFIAEIKRRPDVEIFHVTRDNRDQLPQHLTGRGENRDTPEWHGVNDDFP